MTNVAGREAGRVICSADLGGGRELEVDYQGAENVWVAAGPGIDSADLWIKGKDKVPDFRVKVERTDAGIQIMVDRGQQSDRWWRPEATPRLAITIGPGTQSALVTASVGEGNGFQEVLLGRTEI